MMALKEFYTMKLHVKVFETRQEMGNCVAHDVAERLRELLSEKETVNIVFAAAPSQNEFLESLVSEKYIDWQRINIFHMDEYIGLSQTSPQSFGRFIKEKVADCVPIRRFYPIYGAAENPGEECKRYSDLLETNKADIVCLGIGENGHIAFNDPHEADFFDRCSVKVVNLDETCRRQQVNDKCFSSLEEVPKQAITLTIPAILRASSLFCTVPGLSKAHAVEEVLFGDISCRWPASILRIHNDAKFYCDKDSAFYLNKY